MKLCSACLLGVKCRYDGQSKPDDKVIELSRTETLIPVCPEQLGGLTTPRQGAEIQGGVGSDVLNGTAKIQDQYGKDVTAEFIAGAEEVLKLAKLFNITEAILKQKSPSCGCGRIYDGTFSRTMIDGDGVTAALLKKNGINVITEEDLNS